MKQLNFNFLTFKEYSISIGISYLTVIWGIFSCSPIKWTHLFFLPSFGYSLRIRHTNIRIWRWIVNSIFPFLLLNCLGCLLSMAGSLPGVECARRRRFHQSVAWSDSPNMAVHGGTRRSSFCLYTSNHDTHHSYTSSLVHLSIKFSFSFYFEYLFLMSLSQHQPKKAAKNFIKPSKPGWEARRSSQRSQGKIRWEVKNAKEIIRN